MEVVFILAVHGEDVDVTDVVLLSLYLSMVCFSLLLIALFWLFMVMAVMYNVLIGR